MADTQSVVSDVKLFLERLKKEMPEIFGTAETPSAQTDGAAPAASPANKVLYNGDLFEARTYITPDQEEGVAFDGTVFHVYLQSKDSNPSALVTQWLRDKAAEVLPQKTKEWAEKIGVEYNRVVLKDQRTLWASCSSQKNINYSYRIVKMPTVVQDYLVIHELCHLKFMNHGEEYWNLVGQFSPDYKLHRRWLNEHKDAVFEDINIALTPDNTQEETTVDKPQENSERP
ncbi:M48 family metallopeptidase [Candidatus Avelusimicrobium caledoniensis]|uniref:M48 family metallopeptidase n=1 Tax=Candidatus Avelusimicrobium caledoniensis TaxID=3416220 RepID=UPI003D1056B5